MTTRALHRPDTVRRLICLFTLALLTTSCSRPSPMTDGHWLGDLRHTTGVERIGTTVREEGVLYIEHELRFAGLPEESVAIGTRYQVA